MDLNLHKLSEDTYVVVVLTAFLLAGAIAFIFKFSPDLFYRLDIFRLIALAIGIIAPIMVINFWSFSRFAKQEHFNLLYFSMGAAALSLLLLYGSICYGFYRNITARFAISSIIQFEFGVAIFASVKRRVIDWWNKRKGA